MALEVIGTGFGRTGTESMQNALEILGFGPRHHARKVFADPEQMALWNAVAAGETPDWNNLFYGYKSCVDWPSVSYWQTLIDVYPDARVILTWRTPESWWESFEPPCCL